MVNFKDIPPETLIREVSSKLSKEIEEPKWAKEVKTGQHKERGPNDANWYYIRVASLLRKVAVNSPIGIEKLAAEYGGKVDRGSKAHHAGKGSRKVIRNALQDLEKLGYVLKNKKGRSISSAGTKLLNSAALNVSAELKEKIPSMEKYI
ncbi:MAG: 30S ribosomal protein S19e [Thermoplasmatales archaeon]|jgi:small subunit ribosomal protein S19e|nr:30S ribosomal protein S19e [Candidatus Thermoplasmatota archaeon]MCL6002586.1 30S ribosomal protein S19e [Candidatus Thermoplasmatota archaeon]MDA8054872.1 30S ribosomal protein S19e [Thermoplasmatales archaeon]